MREIQTGLAVQRGGAGRRPRRLNSHTPHIIVDGLGGTSGTTGRPGCSGRKMRSVSERPSNMLERVVCTDVKRRGQEEGAFACSTPDHREPDNRSLYEQSRFRSAVGTEFRPGGLDLTQEMAGLCALQPGQRVLDVGCGVGSTASFLNRRWGVDSVGLDSSAHFIAEGSASDSKVSWVVGRAEEIPYPDGHFDAVFSECFLSSLRDPVRVLRETRRVLRSGGRLAVADLYLRRPEAISLSSKSLPAGACLRGALGREATLALYEQAGFTVLAWRDRSDTLKALMASLIFAYGSTSAFWDAALGPDMGLRKAVADAKPGYYLVVAERASTVSGKGI